LVKLVEVLKKHLISGEESELQIGDIIRIGYLIPEGGKDRTQYYEGLVIAKQNRGLAKVLHFVVQYKELVLSKFCNKFTKNCFDYKKTIVKLDVQNYIIYVLSGKTRLKVKL
jgi:ribosomal protein L19